MKKIFLPLILLVLFLSCEKSKPLVEAEIIDFSLNKCMCCPGWVIKTGNDTIKSDSRIVFDSMAVWYPSYKFTEPVNVHIEIGNKEEDCSGYNFPDYYEIKRIELRK